MKTDTFVSPAEALGQLREVLRGGNGKPLPAEMDRLLEQLGAAVVEQQAREEDLARELERWRDSFQETAATLARYRELFEFAPNGYLVTDASGMILEANQTASQLLNTSREFLTGKPLFMYLPPEDRHALYTHLADLQRGQSSVQDWELRVLPRKGGPFHAAVTVTPGGIAAGKPVALRWLLRDITARKEAEEALRAEKEFAENLFDTATTPALLLDSRGRILRVNPCLEQVTGSARQELVGRNWLSLIPEPSRSEMENEFRLALAEGRTGHLITPLEDKDGDVRTVEWTARTLTGADGAVRAVLVMGHDITELQEAQRRAVELERLAAIGQMATGLAHESRNALQRSQACLAMLRWRLRDNAEALDLVARTQKAQDDLLHLYEDVRQYAAPIRIEGAPCNLAEVWREAWKQVTVLCPDRDAQLVEEIEGADLVCEADRFRLLQVFRNIFENSLAACPDPARVHVLGVEVELDGWPAITIIIRDNGPGFSPEQRHRLFEPFFTTKVKGTGLGMAIAKRVITAHGGQITVGEEDSDTESERTENRGEEGGSWKQPPHGATILITLPRRLA